MLMLLHYLHHHDFSQLVLRRDEDKDEDKDEDACLFFPSSSPAAPGGGDGSDPSHLDLNTGEVELSR